MARRRGCKGLVVVARGVLLAGAALAGGCAVVLEPSPAPRDLSSEAPPAPRAPDGGQQESADLRLLYADYEAELMASGRMRRDVAPADAPFTDDDLARNFVRIALHDEYTDVNGRYMHEERAEVLRRWEAPVRVAVMTGASEMREDAARDRANVAAFARRLAQVTGHDVGMAESYDVNFLVLFMTRAEGTVFADKVRETYPDFAPAVVTALENTAVDNFCASYAFFDEAAYSAVMILIRAEHPAFTKLSCVQEEMSQAMGLPNDSPDARPSLYNDDLEFALLTEHDAILLRMLYDPRLRPGMTADEVLPLLPAIAADARAAARADAGAAQAVN